MKIKSRHPILIYLLMIAGMGFGSTLGVGGYTFFYAKGASYMTNDPAACMNCHIMREQYDGWLKSSHRNVAVCNDCHAPHDLIGKYMTKGINGYHHSVAFTTGDFHEPIQITERNLKITENACRDCHGAITSAIEPHVEPGTEWKELSCTSCHPSVGHLHMD